MTARFEIDYQYATNGSLGAGERRPIMIAWTTAPQEAKHAAAFHRHKLALVGAKSDVTRVAFPYDPEQVWPQDATVRFLLMTALRSSEGKWTYAKSASTQVYLADLLAAPPNGAFQRQRMDIQSYYMPTPGQDDEKLVDAERHKGDLHVRLAPTEINRRLLSSAAKGVRWAPPDPLDVTPVNVPSLQAAMMLAVDRSMSPFRPEISKSALRLTLPELRNVHAPLYVQETQVPLDGSTFWTLVPDVAHGHVHHHGGVREADQYLDVLLRQGMARHNMSQERFLEAAKAFRLARSGGRRTRATRVSDTQIQRAVRVLATACTMRANAMRYAADKAILAKSKQAVVVESFDQVDIRTGLAKDTGGVRSRVLQGSATAAAAASAATTVRTGRSGNNNNNNNNNNNKGLQDDDRSLANEGTADCEDSGRDSAVHFVLIADPDAGIPDDKIRSPLLKAARHIASHYRAVGVLCSVSSRNLADARKDSGSNSADDDDDDDETGPPIGSFRDRQVEVGAHMFTLLVPQRVLHTNVNRALQNRKATDSQVDLGTLNTTPALAAFARHDYLQVPSGSPLSRGRELPVALCEGTGILDPLMLAREHYVQGVQAKAAAAMSVVLDQEADARMRTGKTTNELAIIAAEVQAQIDAQVQEARRRGKRTGTVEVDINLPAEARKNPPPPALEKFTAMHSQTWLQDHPDKRIVPKSFYRTAAELYLVPPYAQLKMIRSRSSSSSSSHVTTTTTTTTTTHDAEESTPPIILAGNRMIPIQIGHRSRKDGVAVGGEGGGGAGGRMQKHRPATWGVAISDILRQRSFVGFLPTPAPSTLESRIVDRVHSHVAPAVALHLDTDLGENRYVAAANRWHREMNQKGSVSAGGMPKIHPTLNRLQRALGMQGLHQRYALVHGYAHPKDLHDSEMRSLMRWLRDKNPHVVAAELHVERFTYQLAMVRLDALVDCGADTLREAKPHIDALFRNRSLVSKGLLPTQKAVTVSASRSFRFLRTGCGLPHGGSFVPIMEEHIQLTVKYVLASWRKRHESEVIPLTDPSVQALIRQFTDWGKAIDGRTSAQALEYYRVMWRDLTDKDYGDMIMPSPGRLWVQELIRDHTVYAKQLADAAWYPDDPVQRRRKKRAIANVTGLNAQRIARFWSALIFDPAVRQRITKLWMAHLHCTLAYIEALQRTGDPKSNEFLDAVADCLEKGRRFGTRVNSGMQSMTLPSSGNDL